MVSQQGQIAVSALVALGLVMVTSAAAMSLPTTPLLPGLLNAAGPDGSLLCRGYDPVFMKPRGAVATFHYTNLWGDNNQWYDPATRQTYRKPDEISEVAAEPSAETSESVKEFTSFDSYLKFRQSESWSGFDLFFIAFSHGTSSGFVNQTLSSSKHVLAVADHVITTHKMGMYPTFVLQDLMKNNGAQSQNAFARDQAVLPMTNDNASYSYFIEKYGTHFAQSAMYGGYLNVMIALNQSVVASQGSSWASKQFSIGIDLVFVSFGFEKASNHTKGELSYLFKKNSRVVLVAYGGDPALVGQKNYVDWAGSVTANSVPVNVTYTPLSELFLDDTKASHMEDAVHEYLTTPPKGAPKQGYCAQAPGVSLSGTSAPGLDAKRRLGAFEVSWDDLPSVAAASAPKPAEESKPRKAGSRALASITPKELPGLNSGIGRGFNAKTGTIGLPVSNFAYNEGKVWFNGVTNQYYAIPDGLLFESLPSACFQETMDTITNATSAWNYLAKSFGVSIGVSYDGITVGLSFAHQMAELQSKLANYTKALSVAHRQYVTYALAYGSSSTAISPQLQEMIDTLGTTAGPEYQELINYWGTHYIARSEFGGYCNFTVTFDKVYLREHSYKETMNQVGLSVGVMFDALGIDVDLGFGFGHMHGKIDKTFSASSNATYTCGGGDVSTSGIIGSHDYNAWSNSIENAPALIPGSVQLRPIADLIYKPTQRQLMVQAIKTYLDKKE